LAEVTLRRHARIFWASIGVKGTAPKGSIVSIQAPCRRKPCATTAVANRRGRWSATLELLRGTASGSATVTAALPGGRVIRRPVSFLAPTGPPLAAERRFFVLIGDSLAEASEPFLPLALPGFNVTVHARSGRALGRGMDVLAQTPLPPGAVLALSLFTNNDPRDVPALEGAVRESVRRAGPRGCAVWATIQRPRVGRVSYRSANRRLVALAGDPAFGGRLQIVRWAEAVKRRPGWLSRDKVHPTPSGRRARASLYGAAAARCPSQPGDPVRQNPSGGHLAPGAAPSSRATAARAHR
ncbi:MAG TPA: hypothetical protein VEQ61_02760, partial [Thermoleophilaceae bacterium]|nr:hypothetical protein [Thermoleophilaceae bacterium]